MKTSNLIGVSADRSAQNVVDYNLQEKKTEGSWRGQEPMNQNQLVSFHGDSNLPGLNVQQKGDLFKSQVDSAIKANQRLRNGAKRDKNWAQCHTVVQSFELIPNPNLTPATVHQMGNELYTNLQAYLKEQYNYNLNSGLVSTHIDREQESINEKAPTHKIRHPHLHNHIILPGYNLEGRSLSSYLRKADIYQLQHMDDGITSSHGLHDYYFGKLERQLSPFSAYSKDEYGIGKKQAKKSFKWSNLEKAGLAFKMANDTAWDENKPMANGDLTDKGFVATRMNRDSILHFQFGYNLKKVKDTKSHKKRTLFTMNGFKQPNTQRQQWYNINNMRLLRWRDRKEMRAERLLWQFDFKGLRKKPVSYESYQFTIGRATRQIPDIGKITKKPLRERFQIKLSSVYHHVEKGLKSAKKRINHARIKMSEKYRKYGKRIVNGARDMYDHMTKFRYKRDKSNFMIDGVNDAIKNAREYRRRHSRVGGKSRPRIHGGFSPTTVQKNLVRNQHNRNNHHDKKPSRGINLD